MQPDILHTLIPACNILGAFAGRKAGIKHIVCSRLSLGVYRDNNRIVAMLEDRTDREFDLVHCKSRGIMEDVARREPIPPSRMRVIYNGIQTELYDSEVDRRDVRSEFGIDESAFLVILLANLHPYKGHHDVIIAAKELCPRYPDLRILFIGRDDAAAETLRQSVRNHGLQKEVIFGGEQHAIPRILKACDALISASHEEGFSNVILEGMASSLPIIATRVGGNPEAVVDGVTGVLIDPHQPVQIAEAIRTLIENPETTRQMGERGRGRVEELFSYRTMINGMQMFYHETMKSHRR